MALEQAIVNPYDGVTEVGYWKVVDLNFNLLTESCHVTLCGWVDKNARINTKEPIVRRSFDWSGNSFNLDVKGNLVMQTYIKIKADTTIDSEGKIATGEFSSSKDLL